MPELPVSDVIEVEQLCAKYAVAMTQQDITTVMEEVFAPGGTYSAFGDTYELRDFPALTEAAPKGLFLCGMPQVDLDVAAGTGSGQVPLLFIDQTNHHMRMGWYTDSYVRTKDGWRLATRSMTFLRRSGDRDAGNAHDPMRPEPSAAPAG